MFGVKYISAELRARYADPSWPRLREYVFRQVHWHCERCNKYTVALQLDHKHYRTLWYERWPEDVQALCVACHWHVTFWRPWQRRGKRALAFALMLVVVMVLVAATPMLLCHMAGMGG